MPPKKTVTLVRHAKSSWDFDLPDHKRPLIERGIADARIIAKKFSENFIMPDAVFTSHAVRAHTTCAIFMETLNIPKEKLTVTQELYDFGGSQVSNFIKSLPDEYQNVMVFGHNHAFTAVSNIFGNVYIDNVPTAGLVQLQFKENLWKDLKKGITLQTLFPKQWR